MFTIKQCGRNLSNRIKMMINYISRSAVQVAVVKLTPSNTGPTTTGPVETLRSGDLIILENVLQLPSMFVRESKSLFGKGLATISM